LGGVLYIFGAFLYMLKVPERFAPGKFDIIVRFLSIISFLGRLSLTFSSFDSGCCSDSLLGQCEQLPRSIALPVPDQGPRRVPSQ
jgi:predicted membrane channel-forming protein YqfA (hemolysin III family)